MITQYTHPIIISICYNFNYVCLFPHSQNIHKTERYGVYSVGPDIHLSSTFCAVISYDLLYLTGLE